MPGQRGTETRQMTWTITVRMPDELYQSAEEVAGSMNLAVATWLRELVANAVTRVELAGPRSKPRAHVKKMPDNRVRELIIVCNKLADLHTVLLELLETRAFLNGQALLGDHDYRQKLRWMIAVVREVSAAVVAATEQLRPS